MSRRCPVPLVAAVLISACGPASGAATLEPSSPSATPTAAAASPAQTASASPSFGPPTVRLRLLGDGPVIEGQSGPPGYRYGLPAAAARSGGELLVFVAWFGPAPGDELVTLSRSADGLTWSVGHEPIYEDDLGLELSNPGAVPQAAVELEDGSWQLFGWGAPTSRPASFTSWRASAPAPEGPWTLDANGLLELGPAGAWDSQTASLVSVLRNADGYRGWFEGQAPGSEVRGDIGYATSSDGLTWTKRPSPIISPGFCGPGTAAAAIQPQVERWRDGFLALFAGHAGPRTRMTVFAATSPDGVAWQCESAAPVFEGADIPDSNGIHTMRSLPLGDGRVGLLVESLRSEGSDLWLAEVEPIG